MKYLNGEYYIQIGLNILSLHLSEEIKKSIFSIFDDKRCYLNNIESKPWN